MLTGIALPTGIANVSHRLLMWLALSTGNRVIQSIPFYLLFHYFSVYFLSYFSKSETKVGVTFSKGHHDILFLNGPLFGSLFQLTFATLAPAHHTCLLRHCPSSPRIQCHVTNKLQTPFPMVPLSLLPPPSLVLVPLASLLQHYSSKILAGLFCLA
jgi:hypothetical protein